MPGWAREGSRERGGQDNQTDGMILARGADRQPDWLSFLNKNVFLILCSSG